MKPNLRRVNTKIFFKAFSVSLALLGLSLVFSQKTHAAACVFTDNSSNTISVSCSLTGTAGVDNGSLVISGAGVSLTIGSPGVPATLFFTPGFSISRASGGALVKAAGSFIQKQYIYYTDGDNDGYAASLTPTYSTAVLSSPSKRRYLMGNIVTADCYDSNANAKPGQTAYFTTNRGDGSFDYDCDAAATQQYTTTNNCP